MVLKDIFSETTCMCVTKSEVSRIILTSFRQGWGWFPPTSKQTTQKPAQIRDNVNFILALLLVLVGKLARSGISLSIFLILVLHTSFLTRSFFTTSLSLLKPPGKGTNLSH